MPEENKLFVGNLPKAFDKNDLSKLFGHFGDIEALKLFHKDKSENAFGFITFKEAEHANEAKKLLNNKTVKKHSIRVDFARSSNDLIIKSSKNKKKRKFGSLPTTTTSNNKVKRRRISHKKENENKNQFRVTKNIPSSRIVNIINIPKTVSMDELKELLHKHIEQNDYQYLIYPSNELSLNDNDMNNAWILYKSVENAQNSVTKLDQLTFNNSIIRVSFARKLNKMYRVKVIHLLCKNKSVIKTFINNYFNNNYKFDDEENKKLAKYNTYAGKNRYYHKKPHESTKKYDVIQNIIVTSTNIIIIEFKKVDYALFATQNMNGIKFKSKTLVFHFELEKYNKDKSIVSIQSIEQNPYMNNYNENIIKIFNIDKTVEYKQLKELIISIIGNKYYEHIIYPAPDSLPTSQTAWICIKKNTNNIGQNIINKLNNTEINNKSVGVICVKSYITPQKVMIRNLSDSITKNDIIKTLKKYGEIKHISMKQKENNNKIEHCGWCFVTFVSVASAVKAIKELNGHKLNNKIIAIDHTLPKDIYNKIQNKWKQYNKEHGIEDILMKEKKKREPIWKLYAFMKDDYEEKTFYKKYVAKNKKNKVKTVTERLDIAISSEPLDYDWLKYFLWKHKLNIIQYECNCKIEINIKNNYVDIFSDNKNDLDKCIIIIRDMLNNKRIREIGYTQIMNIPFELENKDFDWKLYLNGDNFNSKKEFEFTNGCSFIFKGKGKTMQIELIAATKQSLQRGVHFMKNNIFDKEIKNQRDEKMGYKYIKRLHCSFIQLGKNKVRIKQIEKETHCQIRVFGSLCFQFENRKNTKSYYKIMAKNENNLHNACKLINELIENDKKDMENNDKKGKIINKRFWFYSGDANEGRTIFIRNLPFEINEKIIRDKFKEFGHIISIKMVFDKISGNSRGSAFIQYDNTESVNNILSNNNNKHSITLNGRKLIINMAVNKFEAKKIERSSLKNKDKRNLYLAKEGIMLNEDEMKEMDKQELNRRINQWKEKKNKLQNPNFHVSTTRLSIRNIPTFVSDKYLRKVFYDKSIEIRNKLKDQKKEDVFQYKFPKINQVKIVRDDIRKNNKGIGRSKRFGFVEFREHSDALLVLRELNNKICAHTFDFKPGNKSEKEKQKMGKLTVEFAVQDMKKLHFHFEKTKKHQQKWRKANLEKLKDKLEVLKAQKQDDEIKIVEDKINDIQRDIDQEKFEKIQEKKKMLKMKKKNKFAHNKVMKKFKYKKKRKGGGIKHE